MIDKIDENKTYIFERVGDQIYAREFGSGPADRFKVGLEFNHGSSTNRLLRQRHIWDEVFKAAATNTAILDCLNQALILYQLSKNEQ